MNFLIICVIYNKRFPPFANFQNATDWESDPNLSWASWVSIFLSFLLNYPFISLQVSYKDYKIPFHYIQHHSSKLTAIVTSGIHHEGIKKHMKAIIFSVTKQAAPSHNRTIELRT